ncbi:MAG TPA: RHS repeat-associated core domain-containing protein [Phycisphaerae bacterium]|nr:RHS repeat-associated core domain-containing protein [Phycisphaerae bacterium]
MARDLDPNDPQEEWSTIGAEHWTDYDRAMPYGDFDVTINAGTPVVAEQMRYLEGFGLPAQQTVSTGATQYLHGDLIRSTMLTTGQGGTAVSAVSYTAFGEVIGTAPATRYQYAGGWGYESGGFGDDPGLLVLEGAPGTVPITLQHVGFRWYDPSIGRFIQRDPIGLAGGLNVYAYVDAEPLSAIDPDGLQKGAQAPFYPPQRGPYYPPGLDPPYVGPDSPESQWGYDPPTIQMFYGSTSCALGGLLRSRGRGTILSAARTAAGCVVAQGTWSHGQTRPRTRRRRIAARPAARSW